MSFKIKGTAASFPPQVIDNVSVMDWIYRSYRDKDADIWDLETCERIYGVKRRHWAMDSNTGEVMLDYIDVNLAVDAAKKALIEAETDAAELDMIIHTSATPEQIIDPDSALLIHEKLGCRTRCSAFMLTTTCTGFTEALVMATNFIKSGMAKNILITSSNSSSLIPKLNWHMRFFEGDGAAAAVIGEGDSEMILSCLGAHSQLDSPVHLHYNTVGDKSASNKLTWSFKHQYLSYGIPILKEISEEIKQALQSETHKPDLVISHQATPILRRLLSNKLCVEKERVPFDVLINHGNTFNASTGICLDQEIRKLNKSNILAIIAVGVGWRAAYAVIKL
ncbi:MAG: hypothetical protein KJO79_10715 [Verrucomicrobiae bacterium]|nr:hypothetical protein [Verrucomicrobiae bacterium]NNJ87646.1 hypothetical protein [Akkermansiaceae bacterium]